MINKFLPKIKKITIKKFKSTTPIEKIYENIADKNFSALLKTGKILSRHRFSVLGRNPFLIFRAKGNFFSLENWHGKKFYQGDPLLYLEKIINFYAHRDTPQNAFFPGGAIGCLSYEAVRQPHFCCNFDCRPDPPKAGGSPIDELNLPDICFFFFKEFIIFDEIEKTYTQINISVEENKPIFIRRPIIRLRRRTTTVDSAVGKLISNFSQDEYKKAIGRVKEHIARGDIYQANIAQRFKVNFSGDSFLLFKKINELNPAPMSGYLNCGNFTLISSSPERFLKKTGQSIESWPIKGTASRGKTKSQDKNNRQRLLSSPKEAAELAMIIDLIRNDLGRIAQPGTVIVAEPKRIEEYSNVFHLVGVIQAQIKPKSTFSEIIKSCFPGGSVTGCPKIKAMEIIEKIEKIKRSFYCGSIGYIGFNGNFDFNIAIRTFIEKNNCLYFSLGGGITYDSSPTKEYEETLHKGQTMFRILEEIQVSSLRS